MAGLRATYRHPAERRYRRPGGPWTGPTLDGAVAAAGAHDSLVVDGDARLSASEVEHRAAALAGGLRSLGVRRRSIVAWQLPNWHEAVLLHRACWRLGAVAAPLHESVACRRLAARSRMRTSHDRLRPIAIARAGISKVIRSSAAHRSRRLATRSACSRLSPMVSFR